MATPAPALRGTVDSTRASNSGLYPMGQAGADTPACAFLGTGAAGLTIAVLIVTDKRKAMDSKRELWRNPWLAQRFMPSSMKASSGADHSPFRRPPCWLSAATSISLPAKLSTLPCTTGPAAAACSCSPLATC
jgi:hypothetical protein